MTARTALALALCPSLALAGWPSLRGPNHDGSSEAKGVPAEFDAGKNVRWSADMPGSAASTPAVAGGKVFVSSTDEDNETLIALAYDLDSGEELWREVVGNGLAQDNRSNFAGASPAATPDHVVFFYGTGDLAVFTHAGEKVWSKNIQEDHGKFYFLWTFSSSPIVHGDKILMQVLQRDEPVHDFQRGSGKQLSYLLALDLKTGEQVFKVDRPDEAVAEAKEAFSTPVIYDHNGKEQLLITGGDCITGHDPATGKELWRWGTWNPEKIGHWRLVPSAVAGDGVALACAPKRAPVYAVDLADGSLAWKSEDELVTSDVSTPLFYRGHFYILNSDKKTMSCVVPKTGEVKWTGEFGCRGKIEASPTAAGGRIYVISHHGEAFVVAADPSEFEILHRAEMGPGRDGRVRSSVALVDGAALIRTDAKLFCIGR